MVRNEIEFCHSWHSLAKVEVEVEWLEVVDQGACSGAQWGLVTRCNDASIRSLQQPTTLMEPVVRGVAARIRAYARLGRFFVSRDLDELILTDCFELLGSGDETGTREWLHGLGCVNSKFVSLRIIFLPCLNLSLKHIRSLLIRFERLRENCIRLYTNE